MEFILLLVILCTVGALAGFLAGLFGIGGGVVIVPALYQLFGYFGYTAEISMPVAVSTSLAVIIVTAISSTYAHFELGNIDLAVIGRWFPGMILGVLCGTALVLEMSGGRLMIIFSLILFVVALRFIFPPSKTQFRVPSMPLLQSIYAFLVGGLSTMAGLGGGVLGIPILMALGLPVKRAIGTAALFGLLVSVPAVGAILILSSTPDNAPWGTFSLINIPAFLAVSIATVLFAPIGARVGKRADELLLKRLFGGLLFVVGIRMLISGVLN